MENVCINNIVTFAVNLIGCQINTEIMKTIQNLLKLP